MRSTSIDERVHWFFSFSLCACTVRCTIKCYWCNGAVAQFDIRYLFRYLDSIETCQLIDTYCLPMTEFCQLIRLKFRFCRTLKTQPFQHNNFVAFEEKKSKQKSNGMVPFYVGTNFFIILHLQKVTIMMMKCHWWQFTVNILLYLLENCH